ncbi:MAG: RNA ligase family protein [Saprospiraceae bacterium]
MSQSHKYGRTYHFPFSPGTTSDDRINYAYWEQLSNLQKVVHTEKLDGENTCLNQYGVFARSHAAPTVHLWAAYLRERWQMINKDLGNLEVFGENLYAIHSIQYLDLEQHFYVFAIREEDRWLSWEEVKFYAAALDFLTVPEIKLVEPTLKADFEVDILQLVQQESAFQSIDVHTGKASAMEGIVTRNVEGFSVEAFAENVFKYVRKDHVKTDEHWTRNWKRAPLKWEMKQS